MEHQGHGQKFSPALAAQMRSWANLGHMIMGGLLAIVSVLAMLEWIDVLAGLWIYAWPSVLVVAGMALPIGILSHGHEEISRSQILADPQQRQHLIMGSILFLAGLSEILALSMEASILQYGWPSALLIIGTMFVRHVQHSSDNGAVESIRIHRVLGGTLLLAGLARSIMVFSGIHTGAPGLAWIILLYAAARQLVSYREPAGAYLAAALFPFLIASL